MELATYYLHPANNLRFRALVRWEDDADGVLKPKTGLALTAFLAATDDEGATAIHATLSVVCTEVAGKGLYLGTLLGSALTSQLPIGTYPDDTTLYGIITGSGLRVVTPIVVRRVRNPDNL